MVYAAYVWSMALLMSATAAWWHRASAVVKPQHPSLRVSPRRWVKVFGGVGVFGAVVGLVQGVVSVDQWMSEAGVAVTLGSFLFLGALAWVWIVFLARGSIALDARGLSFFIVRVAATEVETIKSGRFVITILRNDGRTPLYIPRLAYNIDGPAFDHILRWHSTANAV